MASKAQALILILSYLLTFSFTIKSSQATTGRIAIYWGQNIDEGNLTSTCDTGYYEIVNLAFLTTFGCGRTPDWDFAGHCTDCTKLQPEIQHCQRKGVKVFLSLGGERGSYGLCSLEDAKEVADFLYNNFLSGQSGPLGRVTLDGIDFDIESGDGYYWDDLAKELDALRRKSKYFYLSAAPQCPIPDTHLDTAIKTFLFDYVFVQFYNNPKCQYNLASGGNANLLLQSWEHWTSLVLSNNTVFMGLPAATDAAPGGGYILPNDLISKVLPYIKPTSNYGGIVLWDRFGDVQNDYSKHVKKYVLHYALRSVTALSNAISECISAALHRMVPKPYAY